MLNLNHLNLIYKFVNCQLIRPLVINSAFKLDPFFTYNTSNIGAQGMFYLTFSSVQFSLVGFYNATQWIVLNRMEWYGIWFYRIETNTRLNSVEWRNILMYVRTYLNIHVRISRICERKVVYYWTSTSGVSETYVHNPFHH